MKVNLSIIYLVLFLSFFFMQVQQSLSFYDDSKSSTRIAIAAVGDSASSEISKRAGRAPYYLVFDGNGVFLKSLRNESQMRGRGARFGVIDLLLKESIKTVIAGNFGDKMKNVLKTNKIEYLERVGIAKQIVETITKNKTDKNAQK